MNSFNHLGIFYKFETRHHGGPIQPESIGQAIALFLIERRRETDHIAAIRGTNEGQAAGNLLCGWNIAAGEQ